MTVVVKTWSSLLACIPGVIVVSYLHTDKTLYIPVTTPCDCFLYMGGDRIDYNHPPH